MATGVKRHLQLAASDAPRGFTSIRRSLRVAALVVVALTVHCSFGDSFIHEKYPARVRRCAAQHQARKVARTVLSDSGDGGMIDVAEDEELIEPRSVVGRRPGFTTLLRRPRGFGSANEAKPHETTPVELRFATQEKNFHTLSSSGESVSEVFVRFPGKMPWKRTGEVTHTANNFEEAVRAQWPLLVERSYYLYPKVRFFLPKNSRIEFGYTNASGAIVSVQEPLPEGFEPKKYVQILQRSGFLSGQKTEEFMEGRLKSMNKGVSKKDWHKRKPYLLDREYNKKLEATKYNKHKQPGSYGSFFSGQFKRGGLVVGTSKMR